jgi:hypothetical protein
MSETLDRRGFLKKSIVASTGAALGLSLEEKALLAQEGKDKTRPDAELPQGDIKGLPWMALRRIIPDRFHGR